MVVNIDDAFRNEMKFNKGCALIVAGSDSDKSHYEKIGEYLGEYGIIYRNKIFSAHKQPKEIMDMISLYNKAEGSMVYVAVVGGTDALSGTLSFHSRHPVISCPPDGLNESCLKNPSGSSNAYIPKPENVGKFVAQIFSGNNVDIRRLIFEINAKKIKSLEQANLLY